MHCDIINVIQKHYVAIGEMGSRRTVMELIIREQILETKNRLQIPTPNKSKILLMSLISAWIRCFEPLRR